MSLVRAEYREDKRVAEIVFARPEKLNALNVEAVEDFFSAVEEVSGNEGLHCIVLRGEGRAFSVGFDLSVGDGFEIEPDETPVINDWRRLLHGGMRWLRLREIPVPVVASLHGYCLGVAALLATLADLVVVAEDTLIGMASVRGGGGWLGPVMSVHLGDRKARELEYRYGRMTGTEAAQWGWANYAVPADQLAAKVDEIVADIANTPRELLEIKKAAMIRIQDKDGLLAAIEAGALYNTIAHRTTAGVAMRQTVRDVGLRETIRRDTEA
jgi:enoyl-CoA hydratase